MSFGWRRTELDTVHQISLGFFTTSNLEHFANLLYGQVNSAS